MKNAMKKLTSLLLVAVLLVGAIPFGAFAAEFDPTAGMNDVPVVTEEGSSLVVIQSAEEPAAALAEAAPAAEAPAEAANEEPATNVLFDLVIVYPDNTTKTFTGLSVPAGTDCYDVLCSKLTKDVADKLLAENNYTKSHQTVVNGMGTMKFVFTAKEQKVNTYLVTMKVNGTSFTSNKEYNHGTELVLNSDLVFKTFGLDIPNGHEITYFRVDNTRYSIGDKLTVTTDLYDGNGKTIMVHTALTGTNGGNSGISGSTGNGGTTGGNQGTTGGNQGTTGGSQTTQPGSVKVTFYDFAGKAIADSAYADTNGKLSAMYVDYVSLLAKRDGYKFLGWKLNNNSDPYTANQIIASLTFDRDTVFYPAYEEIKVQSSTINSTKNQNDIFLNIFVNKDFQNCKTIKLNDHWVISDDKITKDEILQYVVTDYYKASNGNLGLQADKLYYSVGSFMYNWLTDNGTMTIDNISAKRAQGTVTVNIMVTNAVAKNATGNADKSNPKTGDEIYTAMTVMGLSAASLAAVMFFYNKKRYTV